MKNWLLAGWPLVLLLGACGNNDTPSKSYVSIPSLIEEQVAHIDTSLYAITRYDYRGTDTIPFDTIYIPREKFREEAQAFLSIPDLSQPSLAKQFTEESRYDELMKKVIISYFPTDKKNATLQKEELHILPDLAEGDKVTTILASKVINDRNGLQQEELLWLMNESFSIMRIQQRPGQPAEIITTKVSWN
ncbi:MAG: hypothetical protein FJ340_01090 [Sphingomonadales bacterium]|nr:hypothetical protein [Sphingomonadales bacterium]